MKAKINMYIEKNIYDQAQDLLLIELGLKQYEQTEKNTIVKTFSQSFGVSGRLDAEYYQPKYDEILEIINSYHNGVDILDNICKLFNDNFSPNDKVEYNYIELSNIGGTGDIINFEKQYGALLPSRARRIVKTDQVIVSSIEGSLQNCALITKEYNNSLCSIGFYILNSDKINSETLLVLFKSEPIQLLLKKRCSGTILAAINKNDFLTLPIPIIDSEIQEEIAKKIQQSFEIRKKSIASFEYAKQAVEIAIEQNEDIAIRWLEEQIEE